MRGWIDEVEDGIVWGRVFIDGQEKEFHVPLLLVEESQRVELQEGSFCSIVNGELLLDKAVWTTKEMEDADAKAASLAAFLAH